MKREPELDMESVLEVFRDNDERVRGFLENGTDTEHDDDPVRLLSLSSLSTSSSLSLVSSFKWSLAVSLIIVISIIGSIKPCTFPPDLYSIISIIIIIIIIIIFLIILIIIIMVTYSDVRDLRFLKASAAMERISLLLRSLKKNTLLLDRKKNEKKQPLLDHKKNEQNIPYLREMYMKKV